MYQSFFPTSAAYSHTYTNGDRHNQSNHNTDTDYHNNDCQFSAASLQRRNNAVIQQITESNIRRAQYNASPDSVCTQQCTCACHCSHYTLCALYMYIHVHVQFMYMYMYVCTTHVNRKAYTRCTMCYTIHSIVSLVGNYLTLHVCKDLFTTIINKSQLFI